jgi:hypothetical protein
LRSQWARHVSRHRQVLAGHDNGGDDAPGGGSRSGGGAQATWGGSFGQAPFRARSFKSRLVRRKPAGGAAQSRKPSYAKLDGATLDQAWALEVDLTGASLVKASLFATQLEGAHLDGANLTGARVTADLTGAHLAGERFENEDCGADEKNQSVGLMRLMRAIFKTADLSRADLSGADLARADLSFAILSGANLAGAALREADASGADLRGALLKGADVSGLDVDSAHIDSAGVPYRGKAKNLDRGYRECPMSAPGARTATLLLILWGHPRRG